MLPGRYQELDLFIKVLRLLCPNLTDAPEKTEIETEDKKIDTQRPRVMRHQKSILLEIQKLERKEEIKFEKE